MRNPLKAARDKVSDTASVIKDKVVSTKNAPTLDPKAHLWIDRFNKEKGWKSLIQDENQSTSAKSAPTPPPRDKRPPLPPSRDNRPPLPPARDNRPPLPPVNEKLKKQENNLKILEDAISKMDPEDKDYEKRQTQAEQLSEKIAEAQEEEFSDQAVRQEEARQKREKAQAKLSVPEDRMTDLGDEIGRLQGSLTNADDFSKADKERLDEFRKAHESSSDSVDRLNNETRKIPATGNTPAQEVQIIDVAQYRYLCGMLEVALLLYQSGETEKAFEKLNQITMQALRFVNTNTGAVQIDQSENKENFGPFGTILSRVAQAVSFLEKRGYKTASTDLDNRRFLLIDAVDDDKGKTVDELKTAYGKIADKLLEDAEAAYQTVERIENELRAASGLLDTMRLNGNDKEANKEERKVSAFRTDQPLESAFQQAERIRKSIGEQLVKTLNQALGPDAVKKLHKDLDETRKRYDALFKHSVWTGEVLTLKDSQTGKAKGRKKNRNLPRETIVDIELRMHMAEQLAYSGSADAAGEAQGQVDALAQFMKNIDEDPKVFESLRKQIESRETRLAKIDKDFPRYLTPERRDLRSDLADIKSNYMTQDPELTRTQLTDAFNAAANHTREAIRLRTKKRALAKLADALEKLMDSIGKTLKQDYSNGWQKLDGNHSSQVGTMRAIREKIARRTDLSLTGAESDISTLQAQLKTLGKLMAKDTSGKTKKKKGADSVPMTADDHTVLLAFLRDARNGQKTHDHHQSKEKEFKAALKTVVSGASSLKKKLSNLKADLSELDALIQQIKSLDTEMKSTGAFADGVVKAGDLQTRCDNLRNDVDSAREIVDADLKGAAELVVKRANALRAYLDTFLDQKIKPLDDGNELGTAFDNNKIKDFLTTLTKAMPTDLLKEMKTNADIVGDKRNNDKDKRKNARKEALRCVRRLMAVLEGYAPMDHFRKQTFDSGSKQISGLKQALPRLEVKLLTTI